MQRFRRRDRHFSLVGTSAREALRALRSLTTTSPSPVTIAGALNLDLILSGLPETRTPEREGRWPTARGTAQTAASGNGKNRLFMSVFSAEYWGIMPAKIARTGLTKGFGHLDSRGRPKRGEA